MNEGKIINLNEKMDIQNFVSMKKSEREKKYGNCHIHFE